MSIEAVRWAFGLKIDSTCKIVVLALAELAGADWTCVATVRQLIRLTSLTDRTIARTLATLENLGALRVTRQLGLRSCYVLDRSYTPATESPPTESHPRHRVTPDTESPPTQSPGSLRSGNGQTHHPLGNPGLSVGGLRTTHETHEKKEIQRRRSSDSEAPTLLPRASLVDPVAAAYDIYQQAAAKVGWPAARKLTDARRFGLMHCLKECEGLDGWSNAMLKAMNSAFLRGEKGHDANHESWRPDIDWFTTPRFFQRLIEGRYDDRRRRELTPDEWRQAMERES